MRICTSEHQRGFASTEFEHPLFEIVNIWTSEGIWDCDNSFFFVGDVIIAKRFTRYACLSCHMGKGGKGGSRCVCLRNRNSPMFVDHCHGELCQLAHTLISFRSHGHRLKCWCVGSWASCLFCFVFWFSDPRCFFYKMVPWWCDKTQWTHALTSRASILSHFGSSLN